MAGVFDFFATHLPEDRALLEKELVSLEKYFKEPPKLWPESEAERAKILRERRGHSEKVQTMLSIVRSGKPPEEITAELEPFFRQAISN